MKALWVLARMRVLDVTRSTGNMVAFFGLPLMILLVLALVFSSGHPFEVKTVCVVGSPMAFERVRTTLGERPELRLELENSREVARRKLEVRAAEAVVLASESAAPRVWVGQRAGIWGRGLAQLLNNPSGLLELSLSDFGYLHYLFPGLLCSSVMFAGLYGMGYAMARYRQNTFLKKLSTTPLARSTFVLAQLLGRGSLVVAQIGLLLLAGVLLFSLPVRATDVALASLLALLGLLVFSGIGFALSCVIRSEAVLNDVIAALMLPVSLFSGIFFRIDVLPRPVFEVCSRLPSAMMVEAVRATLLYGASFASVAAPVVGLALWGIAAFSLSIRVFRWHD